MLFLSALRRQSDGVRNAIVSVVLFSLWWLYLCFGAAVVRAIEAPVRQQQQQEQQEQRHQQRTAVTKIARHFLEGRDCVSGELASQTVGETLGKMAYAMAPDGSRKCHDLNNKAVSTA